MTVGLLADLICSKAKLPPRKKKSERFNNIIRLYQLHARQKYIAPLTIVHAHARLNLSLYTSTISKHGQGPYKIVRVCVDVIQLMRLLGAVYSTKYLMMTSYMAI